MNNDLEILKEAIYEAYAVADDMAFRQTTNDDNGDYLAFTMITIKRKIHGRLYLITIDSDMQRVKIEMLDESEEVPF